MDFLAWKIKNNHFLTTDPHRSTESGRGSIHQSNKQEERPAGSSVRRRSSPDLINDLEWRRRNHRFFSTDPLTSADAQSQCNIQRCDRQADTTSEIYTPTTRPSSINLNDGFAWKRENTESFVAEPVATDSQFGRNLEDCDHCVDTMEETHPHVVFQSSSSSRFHMKDFLASKSKFPRFPVNDGDHHDDDALAPGFERDVGDRKDGAMAEGNQSPITHSSSSYEALGDENPQIFTNPNATAQSNSGHGKREQNTRTKPSTVQMSFGTYLMMYLEWGLRYPQLSAKDLGRLIGAKPLPLPRSSRARTRVVARRPIGVKFKRRVPIVRPTPVNDCIPLTRSRSPVLVYPPTSSLAYEQGEIMTKLLYWNA